MRTKVLIVTRIWTASGVRPQTIEECVEPWVCGICVKIIGLPVIKLTWGV